MSVSRPEPPTDHRAKVPAQLCEVGLSVVASNRVQGQAQSARTLQSTAAVKPFSESRMPGSPSDSRHFCCIPLITASMVSPKVSRAEAMLPAAKEGLFTGVPQHEAFHAGAEVRFKAMFCRLSLSGRHLRQSVEEGPGTQSETLFSTFQSLESIRL